MAQRGSYAKGVAKREEILERALDVIATEGYDGASVKRIAEAALRHYGVPATLDAPPPVIVPRRDPQSVSREPMLTAGAGTMTPSVPPTDGDAVVPDLRGLDAREALRTLARLTAERGPATIERYNRQRQIGNSGGQMQLRLHSRNACLTRRSSSE